MRFLNSWKIRDRDESLKTPDESDKLWIEEKVGK